MSTKNTLKLIFSILFVWLGLWTQSLLPILLVVVIGDSVSLSPYYRKIHAFLVSKLGKRVRFAEWGIALLISIWLIFFISTNFIETYSFNSSSMQGELKSGDILVVSKLTLGKRMHAADVSRYKRTNSLGNLSRKDIILFNFPEGDSLLVSKPTESYYYLKRLYTLNNSEAKNTNFNDVRFYELEERPRIVSRVYGLPGDSITIEGGLFYANNQFINYPDSAIGRYLVTNKKAALSNTIIKPYNSHHTKAGLVWELFDVDYHRYKDSIPWLKPDLGMKNYPESTVFPYNIHLLWNRDFYGPLYVPKKGATIELSSNNIGIYSRLIESYEQNELNVIDGVAYINGKICSTYTFKMNYYWVQGDNRSHSFDSRYWGFVPENHIIGSVSYLLCSFDDSESAAFSFRPNRFLNLVK